jgi:serine/threonine protein kinase/tetratricopeptide (TPR) repeat protein
MNAQRWQRVQIVFQQAGAQASAERDSFLNQACAGDPDLRAEVDNLLARDAEARRIGFLDGPGPMNGPLHALSGDSRGVGPGPMTLPDYEILGELGRGGMGVVFKARHLKLNRLVALKMTLAGAYARPEELARFRTEAKAVARLEHPHIVRLYDYGDQGGLPYFSMEFVEGGNLAKKLGGPPHPARPAAQLVELLARAMDYAHRQGIVHRDLKPANILLQKKSETPCPKSDKGNGGAASDFGFRISDFEPKIADFGLAKRLDANTGPTQTGAVMGTASYMAPEQAEGQTKRIGPATDVYALGAILYELLTGRPPFLADTPLETLHQVVSQEPVSVCRLQANVPRDLETICLKCLRKEPFKRYASAGALADDLHRFLVGEPIHARPAGPTERLWRWCRRKPAVACLVGALIVVFIGGFTAVAWQWRRAETSYERSEEHFREARKAIVAIARTGYIELRTHSRVQRLRKELMKQALESYTPFTQQRGHDPDVEYDLAGLYCNLGEIEAESGHIKEAIDAQRRAIALAERVDRELRGGMQIQNRIGLAASLFFMGQVRRITGRLPEALASYRGALAMQEQLMVDDPENAWHRRNVALSLWGIANVYVDMGHLGQARSLYDKGRRMQEAILRAQPTHNGHADVLAYMDNSLGLLHYLAGRPEAAIESLQKARQVRQQLFQENPGHIWWQFNLARTLLALGTVSRDRGEPARAAVFLGQAHGLLKRLTDENDTVHAFAKHLADVCCQWGACRREMGQPDKALSLLQEAQSTCRRLLKDQPTVLQSRVVLAESLKQIALVQRAIGQADKALRSFEQSRAAWEKLVKDHPRMPRLRHGLALTYRELASLYGAGNQPEKARLYSRKARQIQERLARDYPEMAEFRRGLERAR